MSGADMHPNMQSFATAFAQMAADERAIRNASSRELAVMEGVLQVVLDSVTAELNRRAAKQRVAQ